MYGDSMKNKRLFIIITVLLCSIIMSLIDGIIQPSYLIKSLFKILLFLFRLIALTASLYTS